MEFEFGGRSISEFRSLSLNCIRWLCVWTFFAQHTSATWRCSGRPYYRHGGFDCHHTRCCVVHEDGLEEPMYLRPHSLVHSGCLRDCGDTQDGRPWPLWVDCSGSCRSACPWIHPSRQMTPGNPGTGEKGDAKKGTECAGINRHVVGDERALQDRGSDSILTSSLAHAVARRQAKRRQRHRWAGRLSSENEEPGADPFLSAGRQHRCLALTREPETGPA